MCYTSNEWDSTKKLDNSVHPMLLQSLIIKVWILYVIILWVAIWPNLVDFYESILSKITAQKNANNFSPLHEKKDTYSCFQPSVSCNEIGLFDLLF